MSEFSDLQGHIQQATASADASRQQIFVGRERVKAIERAKAQIERGKGRDSNEYRALVREQEDAERRIASRTIAPQRHADRPRLCKNLPPLCRSA